MVESGDVRGETEVLLLVVSAVAAVLILLTAAGRTGDSGEGQYSAPTASLLSGPGPRGDAFGVVTLLCISAVAAGILLGVYAWLLSRGYIE